MFWVCIRVQKAHSKTFYPLLLHQVPDGQSHLRLSQYRLDLTVIADTLVDFDTTGPFDQRRRIGDTQIKHLIPMFIRHLQHIRKAGGRYHPNSRTLTLDDRVGN